MSKSAKTKSRRINLTLPAQVYEQVERLATARGESLSGYVATLVQSHLLALHEDTYFAMYDERRTDLALTVQHAISSNQEQLEYRETATKLADAVAKLQAEQLKQGRNINQLARHANTLTAEATASERENFYTVLHDVANSNKDILEKLGELIRYADNTGGKH